MSIESCITCRRTKANLECEICHEPVCKDCVQFLDATTFSFLQEIPENLSHTHYCSVCYDQEVAPMKETYEEVLERARNLYFFFNTQKRQPAIIKKAKLAVKVSNCADRDETILRLAFIAAQEGYNSVIEAEVTSKKIRDEGYQKTSWSGTGLPALCDAEKLERMVTRGED